MDGSLLVAGFKGGGPLSQQYDSTLFRYDPNGSQLNAIQLTSTAEDVLSSIVVAPDGAIYVAGYTKGVLTNGITYTSPAPSGAADAYISKYVLSNGSLSRVWTSLYGTSGFDGATGLTIDNYGNLLVAGITSPSLTTTVINVPPPADTDGFLLTVDSSNGAVLASKEYSTTNNDLIISTAVTPGNQIFVAGISNLVLNSTNTSAVTKEGFVAKADPTIWFKPSASQANEGDTVIFTAYTTGIAPGTTIYWETSGTGITPSDYISGSRVGSGVVGLDGTFSFQQTFVQDSLTEGTDQVQPAFYSDSLYTQRIFGSSQTVSVLDTSTRGVGTIAQTGTWQDRSDLVQIPSAPSIEQPYVAVREYNVLNSTSAQGSKFFLAVFDSPDQPNQYGKLLVGSYNGSDWIYADDFFALYADRNNNNALDPADSLVTRFDLGLDFGALSLSDAEVPAAD